MATVILPNGIYGLKTAMIAQHSWHSMAIYIYTSLDILTGNPPLRLDDHALGLVAPSLCFAAECAPAAVLGSRIDHVLGADGPQLVLRGVVVELPEVASPGADLSRGATGSSPPTAKPG